MKYNIEELGLTFVKAVNGSQEHSKEFFEAITPYIKKIASSYRVNNSNIDDVVQEIFLRLFTYGKSFDPKRGTITVWVSMIANRTLIDTYRKEKRRKKEVHLAEGYEVGGIEEKIEQKEVTLSSISSLTPKMTKRDLNFVRLHFFEQLSYEECSKVIDIPNGTLKSSVSRMYSRLRKNVPKEYGVLA